MAIRGYIPKDTRFLIRNIIFCIAVFLSIISLRTTPVLANPTDGIVSAGSATITSSGNTVEVTETSNKAVIDWRSFDIAKGETTQFIQPSSSAIVLNRINSATPSQIFGHLDANGNIIIINPSGVLFGAGAQVDVNGLLATTANISNQAFMANGQMNFNQPGNPAASIINNGTITAASAGLIGLVAPNVINNGMITARLGTVQLGSADSVTMDFYGDGLLNFGVSPAVQQQLVANGGKISAAGGTIALTAAAGNSVVNSLVKADGELSAPAAAGQNGHIVIYAEGSNAVANNVAANKGQKSGTSTVEVSGTLDASGVGAGQTGGEIKVLGDNVTLNSSAVLNASGDAGGGTIKVGGDFHGKGTTPTALHTTVDNGAQIVANANTTGNGGNVVVWSDNTTQFFGNITAEGGAQSGNGGSIETSGHQLLDFNGTVNLLAQKGATGTLLLDPENVTITNNASVTDSCSSGTCTPTGDTSYLNVGTLNTALASSNVTVTTGASGAQTGNITVNGTADTGGAVAIGWSTGNLLTLSAAGNIAIDAGATITNTYNTVNGTFGAGSIPVVLALRADSGSANGNATAAGSSYGVTNNGTIDMSGSSGAVSIFNDWNFTPVSGTQTANGSWSAATYAPNDTVANQFTTYMLVNSAADLAYIGHNATTLGYTYALGTNIAGGGAAFNGNTPLGTLAGTLDGQYCALTDGSVCGITGFTMTSSSASGVGLFANSSGTIRNLSLGLNVTDNSSNTGIDYVGTLAGYTTGTGTIANVSATGSVNYTTTVGAAATPSARVGGLVGQMSSGLIINSSASGNVTYTYAGTSTGTSTVEIGGLVGLNLSTAATSISGSNASGIVTAQYSATGCSGGPCSGNVAGYIGGLIGYNGVGTAIATSSNYATGNVTSSLSGGSNEEVGGLIGRDWSTSATSIVNSYYQTGTVSYTGTGGTTNLIGGLVGYNVGGTIEGTSGLYSYAVGGISSSGTTTGTFEIGGLVGQNTGTITQAYSTGNVSFSGTAAAAYIGGLVGVNTGALSNITAATESVSGTSTVSGAATNALIIGGLVGFNGGAVGTLTGLSTSGNVTYTYAGTSSGTSTAEVGGLVGWNGSTAATSISGSNVSGIVTAQYSATGCGGGPCSGNVAGYIGGLIGLNSGVTGTTSNDATGNVSSSLSGSAELVGGLIGQNNSSSATSIVNSYYQTGTVSYTGTGGAYAVIGGLVGWNASGGTIEGTGALYSYSTGDVSSGGSTTGTFYIGGLAGLNTGPVTQAYSTGDVSFSGAAPVAYIGGLLGYNTGVVSNITAATESVSGTSTVSGAATNALYIGGMVGSNSSTGTLTGLSTSGNVTYTYAGTSSGTSTTWVGGLVGLNGSTAATSISGSHASGMVTAQYSATGCGGSPCSGNVYGNIGGLIGQNGSNTAVATSSNYATGNVNSSLSGGTNEEVGGLIGLDWSTSPTSIVNSYYQTGTVSYSGTGATTNTFIGGLVGYNAGGGAIEGTGSLYSYATGGISYSGGATGAFYIGGLVGLNSGPITQAYSTGDVSFSGAAPAAYIGGLIGANTGALSNITAATESVSGTSTVSGTATSTLLVGGLVGGNTGTGTLTGLSTSGNVTYTYAGTSSGTSVAKVGGLLGNNSSTAAISVSGSDASGIVTAQYSATGCGGPCSGTVNSYSGGLIGENGGALGNAVVTSSNDATGNVISSLVGATGGLVGLNDGTAAQSIINSYATGAVSYRGNPGSVYAGGLVGQQIFSTSGIVDSGSTGSVYINGELTLSIFPTRSLPDTVAWVSQNLSVPVTQRAQESATQPTHPNYDPEYQLPVIALNGILYISPDLAKMFDLGYMQDGQQKY